jgi:hypothetical protein
MSTENDAPASPRAAEALAALRVSRARKAPRFKEQVFERLLQSAASGADGETARLYEEALDFSGGLLKGEFEPLTQTYKQPGPDEPQFGREAQREVIIDALDMSMHPVSTHVALLRTLGRELPQELHEIAKGSGRVSRLAQKVSSLDKYLGEAKLLRDGLAAFDSPNDYCGHVVEAAHYLKQFQIASAKGGEPVDTLGEIGVATSELVAQLEHSIRPPAGGKAGDEPLQTESLTDEDLLALADALADLGVKGRDQFIARAVLERATGATAAALGFLAEEQLVPALAALDMAAKLIDGLSLSRGSRPGELDDERRKFLSGNAIGRAVAELQEKLDTQGWNAFRQLLDQTDALQHIEANLQPSSLRDEVASRARDLSALRDHVFGPRRELGTIQTQKAKADAIAMGDALISWRGIEVTDDGSVVFARRSESESSEASESEGIAPDVRRQLFVDESISEPVPVDESPNETPKSQMQPQPQPQPQPQRQSLSQPAPLSPMPAPVQSPLQSPVSPRSQVTPGAFSRLRAGTAKRVSGFLDAMTPRSRRVDSKMRAARARTDAEVGKLLFVFSQRKDNFFDGQRRALSSDRDAIIRLINGLPASMKPITSRSGIRNEEDAAYAEFGTSVDRNLQSMSLASFFALHEGIVHEGIAKHDKLVSTSSPQLPYVEIIRERVLHHLYGDPTLPPLSSDELRQIAERAAPQDMPTFVAQVRIRSARKAANQRQAAAALNR